jgi:hypothetical protein
VNIDGIEFTDVTLNNLTITSGRTDPFTQPSAGYCNFELINLNNTSYTFEINSVITILVRNSSNNYVPIFGGWISDYSVGVGSVGSNYVTRAKIYALGSLAKLSKIIDTTSLGEDLEGNQILELLEGNIPQDWEDVPPALTWANFQDNITWLEALSGIGAIDAGQFTMIGKNTDPVNLLSYVDQLAKSGYGILYEDANGNIAYDDYLHRQTYVSVNGWVQISANEALSAGIATTTRIGDIRNKYTVNYGNNANSSFTASDATSQDDYGFYEESETLLIKNTTDATSQATRYINTRKDPYPRFESITYQLANPELGDSDRNALISIFNGMPVQITNLPSNVAAGEFFGFVEGWTFRSGVNSLSLTFFASPKEFSAVNYQLGQTFTASGTYTVPAGVSEIAVYAVGGGGNGAAGAPGAGAVSGRGGGGGGGGNAGIFWHYPVTAGQTYSVVVGGVATATTFGGTLLVAGEAISATGQNGTGKAASTSTAPNNQVLAAGVSGGGSGENGVVNSDGLDAFGQSNPTSLTFPAGFGLPTGLKAGNDGAGGASGGHSATGLNFFVGGAGSNSGVGAYGGAGGEAGPDPTFNVGYPGASAPINSGGGGGGGGGGGYHPIGGTGAGGNGGLGASGVVVIYTR